MIELTKYKAILFDLDGVLWHGRTAVPGAVEAVNRLRQSGKKLLFVTNNAGTSRETQTKKLVSMGFSASIDEVITSGYATARYLFKKYGSSKIFVMGSDELKIEMSAHGHLVVEDKADFVVVGLDLGFNYQKLDQAFQTLYKHGGIFVACNENPILPTESGFRPGVGPSVQALACCLGRPPDLVIGKPHQPIMQIALEAIGLQANECLMVGDILDMDILWAKRAGMDTLYVLSGVGEEADIGKTGIVPNYILNSVAELKNL